jgi:hypothetical protein
MASGDLDDERGSIVELNRLRKQFPKLDAELRNMDREINRDWSIPLGAGISEDGQTVYIDKDFDTEFDGVDISEALATHEIVEWALRKYARIGVDYRRDPHGHRLANAAEDEVVKALGFSWREYDDFVDPQIEREEQQPREELPPDLAMYPYKGTKWE